MEVEEEITHTIQYVYKLMSTFDVVNMEPCIKAP